MTRRFPLAATILWLVITVFSIPPLIADEPDGSAPQGPETVDDDALRLEKRKLALELAKLDVAIAEARNKELAAKLPTSDTKGPSGSVTLNDGAGYYAELLAFHALDTLAEKIVEDIAAKIECKDVVITTQFDLARQVGQWQVIDAKLTDIQAELGKFLQAESPAIETAGAAIVPSILGGAADIAAFFRVDREFTSREIALPDTALVASLARAIASNVNGATILLPELNFKNPGTLAPKIGDVLEQRAKVRKKQEERTTQYETKLDEFATLATTLAGKKGALESETDPVKRKTLSAIVAKLESELEKDKKIELKSYLADNGSYVRVIDAAGALVEAITTAPKGGRSPLESVTALDAIRQHANAMILMIDIVSQGAEIEVTKSAWRSGRVSYIGGAVVVHVLLNEQGGYESSQTTQAHQAASFRGKKGPDDLVMPQKTPPVDCEVMKPQKSCDKK